MDVKQRNSNIELLRIFSMLAIVFHHFSVHRNFYSGSLSVNSLYLMFIQMGGKISVVCFTVISGYFLINSNGLKITKLLKMWLQLITWSLLVYAVSEISRGGRSIYMNCSVHWHLFRRNNGGMRAHILLCFCCRRFSIKGWERYLKSSILLFW